MRKIKSCKRKMSAVSFVMLLTFLTVLSLGTRMTLEVQEQPKYGGTFIVALVTEPTFLNPAITMSSWPHYVGCQVYSALVAYDQNMNPVPELAESWEISSDGLTYKFNLVKNAKWHDGKPFTSDPTQSYSGSNTLLRL